MSTLSDDPVMTQKVGYDTYSNFICTEEILVENPINNARPGNRTQDPVSQQIYTQAAKEIMTLGVTYSKYVLLFITMLFRIPCEPQKEETKCLKKWISR